MNEQNAPERSPEKLRRSLGLFACTMMGVGVILGAGIYALVGKAAALGGNAVWISFLGAAVFAAMTGLSYAELSSFIPRAGGQYYFVQYAFGDAFAFLTTWLLLIGLTVVASTVALGFGGYLNALVRVPIVPAAVASIVLSAAILVYGIRESAWLAGLCTTFEVIGLLVVITLGIPRLGAVDLFESPQGLGGLAAAAALIFFAFIGFEEIVQLSEETRDPTRTIPKAILLSLTITTLLYVLVAIAAVSLIGWERLASSDAPLADVVGEALGTRSGAALAAIAVMSTFNTVLIMLLSAARLVWGAAEDGALPHVLTQVHKTRRTPWVATLAVSAAAALFVISLKRIELVASVSNFALFVTFIFVNAAVIVLRLRQPDTPRPFRVPLQLSGVPLIPIFAILGALLLMSQVGWQPAVLTGALAVVGATLGMFMKRVANVE